MTEPARNGKPKLREIVNRLLDLADVHEGVTGRIHALHVLHTLFKDSKLGEFVAPYAGRGFEITIRGFSEKLWSIRNSSTMLYSILISRMFSNRQNDARQATDVSFFTLFPNLHPFFMTELKQALKDHKRLYHPSLYPILLILQRLQACPLSGSDENTSLMPFVGIIMKLSNSGVFKTRSIAAETLTSIIPSYQIEEFIVKQLSELKKEQNQNAIHGILLQLERAILKVSSHSGELLTAIISKSWLVTSNVCPYTAIEYLRLLGSYITTNSHHSEMKPVHEIQEYLYGFILRTLKCRGSIASLRDEAVRFLIASRSVVHIKDLLSCGEDQITGIIFKDKTLTEWYTVTPYDVSTALRSNRSLRLTALVLKVCSFINFSQF